MSAPKKYHFDVTMSCSGCSGAVERVLKKLDGVDSYDVSLEKQSVDVVTSQPYETVYNTIAKTGKKINGGQEVTA
ncbi:Metal homeostasis factor ATX1 [Candida viswanathii]|uniref:Metal homeostasis factor ATX1 n=1 Tax=Candida viswanathii TaxID=5486 RepID=A0A367Y1B9_9ASCO|nr:Metal homeostasis factor ATX1 [Candida viswanathii]